MARWRRCFLVSGEALASDLARLPPEEALNVERSWAAMSRALDRERAPPLRRTIAARMRAAVHARSGLGGRVDRPSPWVGFALASQTLVIVGLGAIAIHQRQPEVPAYHALGSAPAAAGANLTVVFRPETPERNLRHLLDVSHASLVSGPADMGS